MFHSRQRLATMRTTTNLSHVHLMLTEDALALLVKSVAGLMRVIWATALPVLAAIMKPKVSIDVHIESYILLSVCIAYSRAAETDQTAETCYDENYNAESCAPYADGGCPCPSGEERCGAYEGYLGYCTSVCCADDSGEFRISVIYFHSILRPISLRLLPRS